MWIHPSNRVVDPVVPLVVPLGAVGIETVSVIAVKFAVVLLFPFMVTVTGFVAPVTSPVQLLNMYPELGVAVRITCAP
jgi:hypothetical protein